MAKQEYKSQNLISTSLIKRQDNGVFLSAQMVVFMLPDFFQYLYLNHPSILSIIQFSSAHLENFNFI